MNRICDRCGSEYGHTEAFKAREGLVCPKCAHVDQIKKLGPQRIPVNWAECWNDRWNGMRASEPIYE